MNTCQRCGQSVVNGYGYGTLCVGRGETPIEQIRSYRRFRLCDDCAEMALAWIGILPTPAPHPDRSDEKPPTQPFSCFDERLRV